MYVVAVHARPHKASAYLRLGTAAVVGQRRQLRNEMMFVHCACIPSIPKFGEIDTHLISTFLSSQSPNDS